MTPFFKLPEEIVLSIFEILQSSDLQQCQKVCRSWYGSAHITLLSKGIKLESVVEIQKFVASIDHNPNTLYLNAVKSMQVTDPHRFSYKFDNDIVEKLFLRFPNLETITVRNILCLFEGDNDYKDFLMLCPKLDTFEIGTNQNNRTQYYAAAWTLRHLLTTLIILDTELLQENYGGTAQFISCFPRIRSLGADPDYDLFGFGELLPVFEHLGNLTILSLALEDDNENFAENFLATKPKDIQDLIVKRLSQIRYLECRKQEYFCVNLIKFVSKYLTGLNTITIGSLDNEDWTEVEQQTFCNNVLDIICSAKMWAAVYFSYIQLADLSSCLPAIMDRIFCSTSSARHRVLYFEITDEIHFDEEVINFTIDTDQSQHRLDIYVQHTLGLEAITSNILDKIRNIDELIFALDQNWNHNDINVDIYDAILEKLPSLKQITLDVPKGYKDKDATSQNTYPLIEAVTLRIPTYLGHQKLFDRCSSAFPNLKQLDLDGYWHESAGECKVELSDLTLEILGLDITKMIKERYDNDVRRDMFVIVEDNNKRHVFKVHDSDLLSIVVTDDSELNELVLEEDYIQMYITIHNLVRLAIYARVHDHLKTEKLVGHVFTLN